MKTLVKQTGKILFVLVVLLLLAGGVVAAWVSSWKEDRIASLAAASDIATTTAGPVEYISNGDGPPVLIIHGAPGGYDQGALLGDSLAANGFRVIAPSRPGYLRTPLPGGVMPPANQADVMAALLDKLGVQRAGVVAISAGTQVALEFARRYPGRVSGMVLLSPVENKSPAEAFHTAAPGDFTAWAFSEMVRRDPTRALERILEVTSSISPAQREKAGDGIVSNPEALEWFDNFAGTLGPESPREAGLKNDIAQIPQWRDFPYQTITTPVLVVHGDNDPFLSARAITGRMPSATLLAVPDAGHIVGLAPGFQDERDRINDFLRQHSDNPAAH